MKVLRDFAEGMGEAILGAGAVLVKFLALGVVLTMALAVLGLTLEAFRLIHAEVGRGPSFSEWVSPGMSFAALYLVLAGILLSLLIRMYRRQGVELERNDDRTINDG